MKGWHVKGKWVIGLTGSMLSGKSTALNYFAKQGADTFSCDEIVRELYASPRMLKTIGQLMGTTDKTKISALIFKNKTHREALEKLLHPLIFKALKKRITQSAKRIVVVEVPLLFEAGWGLYTDLNIAVLADPKTLPVRLKGRNLTVQEYKRRLAHQFTDAEKANRADVVFFHASKAQLKKSVERFCNVFEVIK